MPSADFEPTIPAIERPQIYALDRTANGIIKSVHYFNNVYCNKQFRLSRCVQMFRDITTLGTLSDTTTVVLPSQQNV
jgi:hypothetical protein